MHFSKKCILGTAKLNRSLESLIFEICFSEKKDLTYKIEPCINTLFSCIMITLSEGTFELSQLGTEIWPIRLNPLIALISDKKRNACFGGLEWCYRVEKVINRFSTIYFLYLFLKFETDKTNIFISTDDFRTGLLVKPYGSN